MKTVADQFAKTLAAAGVKRIYGIVGDSLNGLTDALRRQGKIEWVHVRHEEAAAGAEAHLTGDLAVCAGSCGPGNLHLINGLFDCHRFRVPVLAIAAHIPSAEIGAGYFQETHPEALFQERSHYCELISGAPQMPRTLEVAIRQAVGNRGVSVVVIPGDVALQPALDAPAPKVSSLLLCGASAREPPMDTRPAAFVLAFSVRRRRDGCSFYMVALTFVSAFGTLAISFWPYLIPGAVTVEEAAAPHSSLAFMFWSESVFVFRQILFYTGVSYRVLRGKVGATAGHY
jgi:hypothetical protein